ncbi:MAG: isochorismatase family protein [Candidatus Thermoplasmatota archaeon]|jgi:nicotinamidase-related amidase|nr:isochorismatase family protein [Candidatus Thermoplasmatota archaeon]MDP7264551.1 isochorismatase family protein [Candidatus Thermoplasmatota archaeon]
MEICKIKFIAVDMQYDFTRPGGACYFPRPCTDFIKSILLPALSERGIRIHEIIADYRQPRPGDPRDICHPGEWGYRSEIPDEAKYDDIWIKSLNSPSWTRVNAGDPDGAGGLPIADHENFTRWLHKGIGIPDVTKIVLFGLTLDCCVFCTAQDLMFRGYDVLILEEGTDTRSGDGIEKEYLLNKPPLIYWAKPIRWDDLIIML